MQNRSSIYHKHIAAYVGQASSLKKSVSFFTARCKMIKFLKSRIIKQAILGILMPHVNTYFYIPVEKYGKSTLVLLVDYKHAYDKIKRKELYKVLEELEVSKKIKNMICLTLKKTENRAKVNNRRLSSVLPI